jgi:EAL domain-containing protein (putative c-di-GMP-specific phosphodiesterase class I)
VAADVLRVSITVGHRPRQIPVGIVGGARGELPLGDIHSAFQPVVDLDTLAVVGYEALARGPVGTPWERPEVLFEAGRATGRLAELDGACRSAAFGGARQAALTAPLWLFVNAEPEVLHTWALSPLEEMDGADLPIMVEITERALTHRPAELLTAVERLRKLGWGIALDDVGADSASLALLPLLAPDVIKLDLHLVQRRPGRDVAAVMNAVHAEAERSGALLLAEGLETPEHIMRARAFGATLGQGWHFGTPGPLPDHPAPPPITSRLRLRPRSPRSVASRSPFELVTQHRTPRTADRQLLLEVSKQLEEQAAAGGGSAVVLATFQDARFFTPATRRRYHRLAQTAAFVAALGADMPAVPLPGVRGGVLAPDDPLRREWNVAVVGPHFAATLVAQEVPGSSDDEEDRLFSFVLSHDRELAVSVASMLMSRVTPRPPRGAPHH